MQNATESARQLAELKQLGVSISLDDFGTGYSSLSRLVRLPIDNLKIDQGFVQRLDGTGGAETVVRAIVALAHDLGMKTVAEGVESNRDLKALKAMGCDLAQGFFLAKPMSAALLQEATVQPSCHVGRSAGQNGQLTNFSHHGTRDFLN
jgi:EAL domain-containing protein (putative c-di-GMP-specific phosphodiesterase class I)